jgi:hypothetical protein
MERWTYGAAGASGLSLARLSRKPVQHPLHSLFL